MWGSRKLETGTYKLESAPGFRFQIVVYRFEDLHMAFRSLMTQRRKRIALIAHDNMKPDILEWATYNRGTLGRHELFATGTTGGMLSSELGLTVHRFRSGPLGGDQQVGAGVAEGRIDFIIFFWDPLAPHPHDVDVKALLRLAVVLQRADRLQPRDSGFPAVEPADG